MKQNHIIHKVFIEVAAENTQKAYLIKDDINGFLGIEVFPKLEIYLDVLQARLPGQTVQIPGLVLSLNESGVSLDINLKNSIAEQFEKALEEAVKPVLDPGDDRVYDTTDNDKVSLLNEPEKLLRTFIYFLEKGCMPWWNSNNNTINVLETKVFEKIISDKGFESSFAAVIRKPGVRQRIINQLTNAQIKRICMTVIKSKDLRIDLKSDAIKRVSQPASANRNIFWSLILDIIDSYSNHPADNHEAYVLRQITKAIPLLKIAGSNNSEKPIPEEIISIFPFIGQKHTLDSIGSQLDIAKAQSGNPENKTRQPEEANLFLKDDRSTQSADGPHEDAAYHVQNAGLVLTHPFMVHLFRDCNLIDLQTQKLTDPGLCVHLLHYIATGKTNQPESNMLFEKFLCNLDLNQSISRHVRLSKKHKRYAKNVTEAVLENWSAMKNASEGLLQTEFFQRAGKLSLQDNPTLTLERKGQDILLDKLSWGIGLIKLPWQDQFIYVNW